MTSMIRGASVPSGHARRILYMFSLHAADCSVPASAGNIHLTNRATMCGAVYNALKRHQASCAEVFHCA